MSLEGRTPICEMLVITLHLGIIGHGTLMRNCQAAEQSLNELKALPSTSEAQIAAGKLLRGNISSVPSR